MVVPDVGNIWPLIKETDTDGVQMLKAVESSYFVSPTYPDPPLTVLKDSSRLESLALDLKLQKELHSSSSHSGYLNSDASPMTVSSHSALFFSEQAERIRFESEDMPMLQARQELPITRSETLQGPRKKEDKLELPMGRAVTLQDLPSADKKKKNSESSGDSPDSPKKKGRQSTSQEKKTGSNVIGKSKGVDFADRRPRARSFREHPKSSGDGGDSTDAPAISKKKSVRGRAERSSTSRHKHSPSPIQSQRSKVGLETV